MESVSLILRNADKYDDAVYGGLPQASTMDLITKDGATEGGRPGVVVTFLAQLPDGSLVRAQATTTVRLLLAALRGLQAAHPGLE